MKEKSRAIDVDGTVCVDKSLRFVEMMIEIEENKTPAMIISAKVAQTRHCSIAGG